MTYFEMFCAGTLALPALVAIGFGIYYIIKEWKEKKYDKERNKR